jgi:hypothetical protein
MQDILSENHFVLNRFNLLKNTVAPNQKKIFKIKLNPLALSISFTVQSFQIKLIVKNEIWIL